MEKLIVFVEGDFGRQVSEQLCRSAHEVQTLSLVGSQDRFDELVAESGFVCVALWRRYVGECEKLDAACGRQKAPWSSAYLDGTKLIVGPLISPGRGACYACFQRRRMTHVAMPDRESSLDRVYANDSTLGVAGFVPSSVFMAAAALLIDKKDHAAATGRIRQIDLLNGNIEETRVVRVHGCARCSQPQKAGHRYVERLVPAVKEILS